MTPFGWDINLFGGSSFFENNYAYIKPARLSDLLKSPDDLSIYFGPDVTDENLIPKGQYAIDFYKNNNPRFANLSNDIMGPSFYLRLNPNHSLGIITRARIAGSGGGISNNLSYYVYDPQPFFEDFKVDAFRFGMMAWSEVGLNYAYRTETTRGTLAIGLTAKYLQGYEAAYWTNEDAFQLTKLPGDSLSGTALDFNYGYTNSNISSDNHSLQVNGRGMGLDLGLVYAQTDGEENYKWKIGVSVLDIGKISFNQNAQAHHVQTDQLNIVGTEIYQSLDAAEEFEEKIRVFSEQMLGDPGASLKDTRFDMWLPTALSIQFDLALAKKLYLGSALVSQIPIGKEGVRRKGLLSVSPRYESRWFSASMPISLYNWSSLRTGLAVRLAFLTIGTDNLGSLVSRKDLSGYDFYFAIKVNPFGFGKTAGENGGKALRRSGKGKQMPCYKF
ncbi:MAG: hypothetical protein DHS20C18_45520 [Saprospiraceae bacterium]|nr:MAG: hypothetical protein DHS20C18_45520 [Saprospiraceae bacterium]